MPAHPCCRIHLFYRFNNMSTRSPLLFCPWGVSMECQTLMFRGTLRNRRYRPIQVQNTWELSNTVSLWNSEWQQNIAQATQDQHATVYDILHYLGSQWTSSFRWWVKEGSSWPSQHAKQTLCVLQIWSLGETWLKGWEIGTSFLFRCKMNIRLS